MMRLPPDQFWSMSLAEWRLLSGSDKDEALSRDAFEALRKTYPDMNEGRVR